MKQTVLLECLFVCCKPLVSGVVTDRHHDGVHVNHTIASAE